MDDTKKITSKIDLPTTLTEEFQNRWQDFQSAAEAASIPPITNSEILKSIERVFAFSDFVAAGCARDPAMPVDLIDSGDLIRRYAKDEYKNCPRYFPALPMKKL